MMACRKKIAGCITGLIVLVCLNTKAQQFNPELLGKMVPGQMIFANGTPQAVSIKYQMPESFKNPQNKFTISTGAEPYIHSGGIEAFTVDNLIWALRSVPEGTDGYKSNTVQFVILTRQGAIEQYEYVIYGKPTDKEDAVYATIGNRTRTITRKSATNEYVTGTLTEEKLLEWISDSPTVLADFEKAKAQAASAKKKQDSLKAAGQGGTREVKSKGLMGALEKASGKAEQQSQTAAASVDLNRIIHNYNADYEQRNPGKVKYYFVDAPTWRALPAPTKTQAELKADKEARLKAMYADRSDKVSPAMASAKVNTPVKKETFAAKLDRIKADGNKVGVILYLAPAAAKKPDANPNSMSTQSMPSNLIGLEGEYLDESLKVVGAELVKELAESLGTSDIDLINLSDVPYREVKVMGTQTRIDDFWATKYKVVFAYSLDPRLSIENQEIGGKMKFTAALNMVASMMVTEYIGDNTSVKKDILAQILNMGSFVTPTYSQDEEMTDIETIYRKTLEKLEVPVLQKIKAGRAAEMPKLVKRLD